MSVRLYKRDPNVVVEAADRVLALGTETLSGELEDTLQALAPRGETRQLQAGIEAQRIGDTEYDFTADQEYARFVIEGTKSHFVRPTRAQALHWVQGGQDFFSRGHEVSGITANNFPERAVDVERSSIEGYYSEAAAAVQRQMS